MFESFIGQVRKLCNPVMRENGFTHTETRVEDDCCLIDYKKGELYVRIQASANPYDGVPHFNVLLGEGSRQYPACERNCVALWQMIQLINKNGHHTEYCIQDDDVMHHNVIKAVSELQNYHGGFLDGCLNFFHQALQKVNAERRSVHH